MTLIYESKHFQNAEIIKHKQQRVISRIKNYEFPSTLMYLYEGENDIVNGQL